MVIFSCNLQRKEGGDCLPFFLLDENLNNILVIDNFLKDISSKTKNLKSKKTICFVTNDTKLNLYSYDLIIATKFINENFVRVRNATKALGSFYSATTSSHTNKLIDILNKNNISYSIVTAYEMH